MKPAARSILILFIIGTFVSVQQVSSEEIIDCAGRELRLEHLAGVGTALSMDRAEQFFSYDADTLETFDVELEEEKEGNLYKEIAIAAIVVVMVGYMVITLFNPGEEEEESPSNGKDIPGPFVGISMPISP